MRSSHKLAVRRVANTAGYGSVNRAYLHGISTMDSALNCSVAAILRPLFPTRERKHYDRGKKRVTGAPARLSLRKCFYRPPQLSTSPPISIRRVSSRLLEAKKLPPRFQRTIPRFHTDLLDIYAISRISTMVFNGRCSPLPRPFRGTLISSIDSRQKAGASFAIQFSIQKKTTWTGKNLRWQKAEDDFERSSVFFRRTSQVGAVHAKIEGFGEQREQKGTRHSFRFIARAHKKTGARPSVASRLSLGHPRPWKRTRKSRPDANVADFSIRNR